MTKSAEKQPSLWPAHYQIKVSGQLDPCWSAWFDGLTVAYDADDNTTLTGYVADPAAFYGLIGRARDLNLTILTVIRSAPDERGSSLHQAQGDK
jgi:hypothetical protein